MIVRSPAEQANFLFRAPAVFRALDTDKSPFLVDLVAGEESAPEGRVRLRRAMLDKAEGRKSTEDLARAREAEYGEGLDGKQERSSDGACCHVRVAGKERVRRVLLVRDGEYLYELFLEHAPPDSALAAELTSIQDGFTILCPKGAPEHAVRSPEELKARYLEHDYYRLKVYKPAGFVERGVDPDHDKGIWLHLRREDEYRNTCEIHIRIHLARTLNRAVENIAQDRVDGFVQRYLKARAPKRPKRARWPGAKMAYKAYMVGRLQKSGLVVQQDYRLVEHENGRVYEFCVTTFAGAEREFKKDLQAFWKKLKIRSK